MQIPRDADCPKAIRSAVEADYDGLAERGLPQPWEDFVAERYGIDLRSEYGGFPIRNPWGKASGQLSMNARQVAEDVEAGLGFVVLKTVIAQDAAGGQSMQAWAIKESRMVVEPITSQSGETGWTVTWKGRGWWQSFDDYVQLVRDARRIAHEAARHPTTNRLETCSTSGSETLIVPSLKFHLPQPGESAWRTAEYDYTTQRLLEAWRGDGQTFSPMPLEKDFSPTLAGSDRASVQANILDWLRTVPRLVRAAAGRNAVRVGLKLFNALFDDAFQLEMLDAIHAAGEDRPDFFVYGNRLFDPERVFDGHRGVAYGGPDLSDRNLRVMSEFQQRNPAMLPWCATGNITTGRMALEYALCGAECFQLHTFFQLPLDQYRLKAGTRTQRTIYELMLHPREGFVVWMHHVAKRLGMSSVSIRFRDGTRPGR